MLNKCKQVTVADVISGWHFSGPLADCIRRKNERSFGISTESWARLRWGERWAREAVRGWSGRAIAKWFSWRKMQDQSPKDKWSFGVCDWWTAHLP